MNVGDKVRVLPSEEHSHSNRIGTVVESRPRTHSLVPDVLVVVISPTRRPSLISHTTYRRAMLNASLYVDELEVVA